MLHFLQQRSSFRLETNIQCGLVCPNSFCRFTGVLQNDAKMMDRSLSFYVGCVLFMPPHENFSWLAVQLSSKLQLACSAAGRRCIKDGGTYWLFREQSLEDQEVIPKFSDEDQRRGSRASSTNEFILGAEEVVCLNGLRKFTQCT